MPNNNREISECGKYYIYHYEQQYYCKKDKCYKKGKKTMKKLIKFGKRGPSQKYITIINEKIKQLTTERQKALIAFLENY